MAQAPCQREATTVGVWIQSFPPPTLRGRCLQAPIWSHVHRRRIGGDRCRHAWPLSMSIGRWMTWCCIHIGWMWCKEMNFQKITRWLCALQNGGNVRIGTVVIFTVPVNNDVDLETIVMIQSVSWFMWMSKRSKRLSALTWKVWVP